MSLFPSTLTGRILDDGVTEPPVIELQGISAGQLATVLTAYTPQTEHTAHTAAIGVNAAAIAALQGQVAALPAAPDLSTRTLWRRTSPPSEGSILANASGLVAVNTSLTQGLAGKANQSALDALQVEVNGKSTPASVDLKLANHPTTAAMNSSITSANNSALATVAATYALKSVVDQLALDVAARQTAADVDQQVATALLPMASTSDLNAAVALRTTPTDVSQLIATALLPFVQQTALDAALALRDGRLDAAEALIAALQAAGYQTSGDIATALLGYVTQGAYDAGQALQDSRLDAADAAILALQNAGPYATSGDLTSLQVSLQSAIDGLLAEIATLGGATNLVNAPAWQGEITFDLLAGTNQVRNLHAVAPLTIQLANDNWTLSFSVDSYSTAQTDALLLPKASEAWVTTQLGGYYTIQGTDDAITAALTNHFTRAEATANLVAGITECKDYTDTSLLDYSDTAQMNQAIADALVPFGTIVQRDAAIAAALAAYYTSAQTDSAIAAGLATIDLSPYWTIAQVQAAITAALVPVTLSNGQSWTGGPTFNLLRGSNVLRNLSVAGALTATFQNLDDTILIESDSYARSETYTQLETGAAITAALDALNLSQYRTEAQVLALIAGELVPYWDQSEVSSFVAGELSNYATNSSVSSSISSALSSYDSSSQVDNKIITALLDFYTRAETDQAIADAVSGGTDLSAYYTSAQTDQEIADAIAGLVGVYVRWTELQAPIINEINIALLDYDTSAQVDAKISGAGFLDQTAGDARYFVRAPGAESGQIWNLVQEQFTPRIVRNLLLEAPLVGDAILGNQSTLRIRSDSWSKAEQAALRSDVARQVLAPKPRSLGKSAAEGPNDRLQADLVDFSQNTRGANKYGLVVTDVFTREVATKALPDKRAETVTQAAAEIIPDLVQDEGNYVVTTDQGNEFQGLERALPGGVVHRQKDPSDRNATAVVDRAIQTLKKDLAGEVARHGGGWGEHVENVTEAYNARPHQAVYAAPEDVETQPATTFRVYQDNAAKFQHNKELTEGRKRRLEEAGAFRAPTNARRSFEPQYGPARDVAGIDSMVVRATDGTETLLKHALPVPRGSAEPKAKLTRPPVPLAIRQLRDFNTGPVAPP